MTYQYWNDYFTDFLQQKKSQHQLRKIPLLSPNVYNFGSNDYLGLAKKPVFIDNKGNSDKLSYGAGSSHLLGGHHPIHEQLEQELATWLGYESTLLFSTGYMANLAATSIVPKNGFLFSHQLNHASIIDGGLLSKATVCRYQDENHLQTWLKKIKHEKPESLQAIITDGVFSMDGCSADFVHIPHENELLMVDDAHGLGVFGENGIGCLNYFKRHNEKKPDLLIGTFGKAFGTSGAFIACSHVVKEFLINQARTFIYTTALSPAIAQQTLSHLKIIQSDQGLQKRHILSEHKEILKYYIPHLEIFDSAIIPLKMETSEQALMVQEELLKHNFYVPAIRAPTASPRLRISLNAQHSLKTVEELAKLMKHVINRVML